MHRRARGFAALVAVLAWSALALQYVLLVASTREQLNLALATLRYFSFFTILSNLLVALVASAAIGDVRDARERRLRSPFVRGAAALCIGVTGLVYFWVLSATWAPQGAQWVVDKLLHYAVPALYLAWWIACAPHRRLRWTDAVRWLALPAGFFAWSLLRGAWLHEYPYPFIDVDALGYAIVLRNAVVVGAVFVALGGVLVAIDRRLART